MRGIGTLDLVTLASALGSALIAGVFFAFSSFVMKALANLPSPSGIAAMQSINLVVISPWFMTIFLGTAVAGVATGVAAILHWQDPRAPYWLAGGLLYLIGTVGVTMVFNVPLNDALARITPAASQAPGFWASYVSSWTAWNHVRTIAALLAAGSFSIAFRQG